MYHLQDIVGRHVFIVISHPNTVTIVAVCDSKDAAEEQCQAYIHEKDGFWQTERKYNTWIEEHYIDGNGS